MSSKIRTFALLLSVLVATAYSAETPPVSAPTANPTATAAPKPIARTLPVMPAGAGEHLTPEQQLQRRLAELIAARERRIAELRAAAAAAGLPDTPGAAAATAATADATLEHPRQDRDQAWRELRAALDAQLAHAGHDKRDVLDPGRPQAQMAVERPLAARNRLAVVECYKDIAASPDGTLADLDTGIALLAEFPEDDLDELDRPRALYLKLWLLAERARRAPDVERAERTAAARTASADLGRRFPHSELARTGAALLLGLDVLTPQKLEAKKP